MRLSKQGGFAVLEVILLVVVVALVGFAITKVVSKTAGPAAKTDQTNQNKPTEIKTAEQDLDKQNLDSPTPDENQLDTDLATF